MDNLTMAVLTAMATNGANSLLGGLTSRSQSQIASTPAPIMSGGGSDPFNGGIMPFQTPQGVVVNQQRQQSGALPGAMMLGAALGAKPAYNAISSAAGKGGGSAFGLGSGGALDTLTSGGSLGGLMGGGAGAGMLSGATGFAPVAGDLGLGATTGAGLLGSSGVSMSELLPFLAL